MNKEDIIRMALESGFGCDTDGHIFTDNQDGICDEYLERFADLVYESVFRDANIAASRTILDAAVLAEREACARVVEELPCECCWGEGAIEVAGDFAAAIRARSNP